MEPILEVKNLTKNFGGITALDNVSFSIYPGEVHALLGENGAGKSTLIKVLSGALNPDSGELFIKDKKFESLTPDLSFKLGISVIYQELNLAENLSVAENIFLGSEIKNNLFVNDTEMKQKTEELLDELGVEIDPDIPVNRLSVSYSQVVEIAKAISKQMEVLIMDEPTSSLSGNEVKLLFQLIERMRDKGAAIIFVSHKLEEIFRIADKVTVLRDGNHIDTLDINTTDREELIELMVGRKLEETFPDKKNSKGNTLLRVEDLSSPEVKDISFSLKKGEIIGLAGLVGAGRTEVARVLFGVDKKLSGQIYLKEQKINPCSPQEAIDLGIGLIPEERKSQGVLLHFGVKQNISYSILKRISRFLMVNESREKNIVKKHYERLRIKAASLEQKVKNLSGGNQQKVVLARTLSTLSDVLIFDDPTRGIDVGTKQEIYQIMIELAAEGKGIMFISSEMPELLGMCDRIFVMKEGEIAGKLSKAEATQDKIMNLAT